VRLVDGARMAAERGARLTGQLLAFSRQQRIAAESLDLNKVIEGMRPLLQSTIGAAVDIRVMPAPDLWAATADRTQFELGILNLAINARDAMPHGGTLTITTANAVREAPTQPEQPEPGDYVSVAVSDTGPGIPEAVRERIFEPFFTTKDVGKGSGLGLPQILGVVKQLGGGVEVRSVPGGGTRASLFLPRAATALVPHQARPGAAPVATGRRLRVMLVDDDGGVRTIAAEMLREAGHEVVEAESGLAALKLLHDPGDRTELLVVDVAMPGMTGVELVMAVRQTWPRLPAIYMTGYADEALFPAGAAQDILRKPFDAAALGAMVARAAARQDGAL